MHTMLFMHHHVHFHTRPSLLGHTNSKCFHHCHNTVFTIAPLNLCRQSEGSLWCSGPSVSGLQGHPATRRAAGTHGAGVIQTGPAADQVSLSLSVISFHLSHDFFCCFLFVSPESKAPSHDALISLKVSLPPCIYLSFPFLLLFSSAFRW